LDLKEKLLKLKELTDQFQGNIKQYKSNIYDEANTRVDFIDKFFELLDWDVRNLQGFSEQYREVVREDKIQIEGKQKAPDYSFRIGKERKFFVEAKKPSVMIKDDILPAFQVRRYGYTAKLPLSILTDFEEFAIYDTRIKPDKNDKASVGRVFYCTYDEYEKHFEFIYNTFSKNAILKGSFDNYIQENKNKKGTSEVDKELLKLVEDWRTELAKNIALRNNEIDIYNLNNAVQKIIDRIIFLRIAEDKEIENYEQLLSLAKSSDIFKNLNDLFIKANKKYNAGLFQPEKWLSELKIDDKVLSSIIKGLYYPECPYEFSILPIEILGNIYEQFLGKTIKFRNVKDGHTAIIEEKPEVRKAGGVYYTPAYIVNYIVENTIGEKIKDKSPEEIAEIKICDPACGSGSFLVGAYYFLLNYHLDYYIKEKNIKKALKDGKIYQVSENNYKLTIEEKQKILINNIYGVDIDPQAVEVTKLSLYLKLLESEGKEAEGFLFKHSDIKLLPTLDKNIKCGNSLIGSDFYKEKDLSLFGNDEMRKVNVFDWDKEFPDIFKNGGFDVVIGNPPYVRIHDIDESYRNYFSKKYISASNQYDLYQLFYEKGLKLLKEKGILGFITSNKFCITNYGLNLRTFIFENYLVKSIIDVSSLSVFKDASTYPYIFIISKEKNNDNEVMVFVSNKENEFNFLYKEKQNNLLKGEEKILTIDVFGDNESICKKLEENRQENLLIVYRGRGTSKDLITENKDNTTISVTNKEINKYFLLEQKYFRLLNLYQNDFDPKLLMKKICFNLEVAYDESGDINPINTVYVIKMNDKNYHFKYLLGILNSKLLTYYARTKYFSTHMRGGYIELRVFEVQQLPIRKIDFSNLTEKARYDKLVSLVDNMLEIQKLFHNAKTDSDKNLYKQKIDIIDSQIDDLVYKLYGLTDEEIKILIN